MTPRISLLAVCYHFPPVGSAGTGRSVRLLPGLRQHGIDTTVVTIDPLDWESPRFTIDLSCAAPVDELPTIRIGDRGWRYAAQRRWPTLHKYLWFAAYPALLDYGSAWSARLRRTRHRVVAAARPDVVYVSAPPFSSIAAASALAAAAGAPLIVDFRDPWTTASLAAHPSRLHFLWERRKERRLLRRADRVILNTDEARELLAKTDDRFAHAAVIPNGAPDGASFGTGGRQQTDQFRLLFAGTLYEDRVVPSRPGQYRPDAIDEGARSLRPLIEALPILAETDAGAHARLKVVVAGTVPASQIRAVEDRGIGERFEFVGSVHHSEALRLMEGADALYLNQVAFEDRSKPMPHVPGKTFEYLASGHPILAPLAQGATRRVLEREPTAHVCDLDDPHALSRGLRHLMQQSPSNHAPPDRSLVTGNSGTDQLAAVVRASLGRTWRDRATPRTSSEPRMGAR